MQIRNCRKTMPRRSIPIGTFNAPTFSQTPLHLAFLEGPVGSNCTSRHGLQAQVPLPVPHKCAPVTAHLHNSIVSIQGIRDRLESRVRNEKRGGAIGWK